MVLGDLGAKISNALRKLQNATIIDEEVLKECLGEVTKALLQSDVNVNYVKRLRDQVMLQVNVESDAAGTNKRKLVQRAVVGELQSMLESDRKPYQMKKGKINVVMFVGLQGSGKTTSCAKYAYHYLRKG